MSVREGATYLGISHRTLHDMIKDHKVKHARIGKRVILKREYLDELITAA